MLGERALHFGGKDIGPAGDDHVAAAIGDVEVAVLVEVTDVAGGPETVWRRGQQRRATEIVVSRAHRRTQIHLAELARPHRPALLIQDPDLGVTEAATDAARVRQPLVAA